MYTLYYIHSQCLSTFSSTILTVLTHSPEVFSLLATPDIACALTSIAFAPSNTANIVPPRPAGVD